MFQKFIIVEDIVRKSRRVRRQIAIIEFAYLLLLKKEESHSFDEECKWLASIILYRIHIQGLRIGNITYVRKENVIENGAVWNLENIKTYLNNV